MPVGRPCGSRSDAGLRGLKGLGAKRGPKVGPGQKTPPTRVPKGNPFTEGVSPPWLRSRRPRHPSHLAGSPREGRRVRRIQTRPEPGEQVPPSAIPVWRVPYSRPARSMRPCTIRRTGLHGGPGCRHCEGAAGHSVGDRAGLLCNRRILQVTATASFLARPYGLDEVGLRFALTPARRPPCHSS